MDWRGGGDFWTVRGSKSLLPTGDWKQLVCEKNSVKSSWVLPIMQQHKTGAERTFFRLSWKSFILLLARPLCVGNLTCRRVVPFRHYANDALQGMQFDWQLGLSVIQAVVDDWLASLTAATADPHCSKSLSSFLPESFKPTNWCMCYSLPHDRPNHRHLSSSEVAPAKIICKSGPQQQRNSRTVAEYHFLSYTMQLCVE